MYLVASVRLSVSAKKSHYQSKVFVCVSNSCVDAVDRLLMFDSTSAASYVFTLHNSFSKFTLRPVKTDFMFNISSRVRFSSNSGKIAQTFISLFS